MDKAVKEIIKSDRAGVKVTNNGIANFIEYPTSDKELADQILSPEDKVKAVKEMIEEATGAIFWTGKWGQRALTELTTQIHQLFKVKLPENPHKHIMKELGKPPCLLNCRACLWDEALQQVKELNEVKE